MGDGPVTFNILILSASIVIGTFGFIYSPEVANEYAHNLGYATVSVVSLCVWPGLGSNPDDLKQVLLPILDRNVCNRPTWYNGQIDETMICAGYEQGGRDVCQVCGP
jgi:Trypsin